MSSLTVQLGVFVICTALIGLFTYFKCRGENRGSADSNKEFFLASGGLSWWFIAGSITLTNLSTDQLVGMNGGQMLLLACWELAAVLGLFVLAKVFLPIYYRYNCTTTTELLEKRYNNTSVRSVVSVMFLLGNVFIYLPVFLYGGSLFMKTMFNVELPLIVIAICFAVLGAAYSVLGGLRAVAVSDTFSGVILLGMALLVVILALNAIDFDFSGIPAERLTLIGDSESSIPWPTLLTGMMLIQTYYWSTNQTITQRAMAAPNIGEAQKGVLAAATLRLLIVPPIVVIPGIVAYKLYGELGDGAYGRIVGDLLPSGLSGLFAAAIAAAVLTSFNSVLNSSAALYVCDLHEKYINDKPNVARLNLVVTVVFVVIALTLVPVYSGAKSIIETLQTLNGLLSMPILATFIVGIVFRQVSAKASILALLVGVLFYAPFAFYPEFRPLHYIHMMFITFTLCVAVSLLSSAFIFGSRPLLDIGSARRSGASPVEGQV